MEKNPIISIVVAMYNIEAYVADCIKSCINQNDVVETDYEIIIVNDGSTDNSLSIAEETIKTVSNARTITQQNAGVSVARNTGIDQAKGEYLWFVDGDDKIEPHAIRTLLEEIEKTACDIYIYNYRSFNQEGIIESSKFESYEQPFAGKYINEHYGRILPNLVWAALYRREFLNAYHLRFMPGIRHEDDEFTIRVNYQAGSINILGDSLYLYRISNNNSFMAKRREDNTESFLSLLKIRESHNAFFGEKSPFYNSRRGHNAFILITYRYDDSFNINNKSKYDAVKRDLYKDVLKYGSWKRKIFVVLSICLPFRIVKIILGESGLLIR